MDNCKNCTGACSSCSSCGGCGGALELGPMEGALLRKLGQFSFLPTGLHLFKYAYRMRPG